MPLADIETSNLLVILTPFVLISMYLSLHEEIGTTVIILVSCSTVCLLMMYYGSKGNDKEGKDQNPERESIKEKIMVSLIYDL